MFEETGITINIDQERFIQLSEAKQKSGKIIYAWAAEADFETVEIKSNLFEMESPPKSGKEQSFPEVDKAAWFNLKDSENENCKWANFADRRIRTENNIKKIIRIKEKTTK